MRRVRRVKDKAQLETVTDGRKLRSVTPKCSASTESKKEDVSGKPVKSEQSL